MRVGLIINPRSRQNRKGRFQVDQSLVGTDIVVETLGGVDSIASRLERLASAGIRTLVVSGGDGTLARILTAIAEGGMFDPLPRIAILPHGTTNMTAKGIGLRLSRGATLTGLDDAVDTGRLKILRRATVRVENPRDVPPQHGMFFGAGAILRAVLASHDGGLGSKLEGEPANFIVMARSVYNAIAGGRRVKPDDIYQPTDMRILADGNTMSTGEHLLFIVTSLDRLVLGSRPFWNTGTAPLKATSIAFPMPALMRTGLKLLYGGAERRLDENVFRSRGVETVELDIASGFTLDGELFDPPKDTPLRIAAGPTFEFVHGRL